MASGLRESLTVISVTNASVPSEPDEERGEIVAGGVALRGADVNDLAVGQDQVESGDVIGGDAVSERVRSAGIFGDVAADGAGFLAGRIGSEVEAIRLDGARKIGVNHSRLNRCALIFEVDFEDAVHARKGDHDAAARGRAPPERPVPAPRPTIGMLLRAASLTTRETCSVVDGKTTASGRPFSIEASYS